ncbi:hypothetical protein B0T16DRAFT_406000 [Cercophora newfieldiana]|uniref:Bulb-type lectin domain-containing protein n=1 Tax=Cercophora newfieldiana TaxID=92897 RepID=A0AA39YJV8_9PEZI|nr:hypothetical protein B0T16DRAFT_406000 [Cercophora newfieldiana]
MSPAAFPCVCSITISFQSFNSATVNLSLTRLNMADRGSVLTPGSWLYAGDSMWSDDHTVQFTVQLDGKMAVYWGGELRWEHSDVQREDIAGVKMQDDGNLVLLCVLFSSFFFLSFFSLFFLFQILCVLSGVSHNFSDGSTNTSAPAWASNTVVNSGMVSLFVENSGNVVLYQGTPIWVTETQKGPGDTDKREKKSDEVNKKANSGGKKRGLGKK